MAVLAEQDLFNAMMKLKGACNSFNTCFAAYDLTITHHLEDKNDIKKKETCTAAGEVYGESIKRMQYEVRPLGAAVEAAYIKLAGGVSPADPAMDAMRRRLMRAVEAAELATSEP